MSKEYIENGTRFGRLVVIKETDGIIRKNVNLERRLLCLCDCGKEIQPIQQAGLFRFPG